MNIEERAAQAAAWKATGQCNCAQAVLKAFEDKLPVDADTLMKLGAGYAAGMGCMESTCGALIGAVMVVVYNTLPQRLLRVYGSPVITGWGMLLGGVILGLLSRVWTQKVTLDAQTVMGILLIGVVGTAMAFTLYLQGVNDIGPVKTSLLSCAELVTAGVLTSVWLKTPLAWQDVLGMALILGMVAFLAVPGRTTPNTTRSNS